jgi:hypothetical protein
MPDEYLHSTEERRHIHLRLRNDCSTLMVFAYPLPTLLALAIW